MRILFGLVGLLITVAIIAFIMVGPIGPGGASYLGTVAKTNKDKRAQVQQFSGKTADGTRANTFVTLAEQSDGFKVTGLTGGPFVTVYGLAPGDVIVRIGPQDVPGYIISSETDVRNFLDDAFARQLSITVRRPNPDGSDTRIELFPAVDSQGRPLGPPPGIPGLSGF